MINEFPDNKIAGIATKRIYLVDKNKAETIVKSQIYGTWKLTKSFNSWTASYDKREEDWLIILDKNQTFKLLKDGKITKTDKFKVNFIHFNNDIITVHFMLKNSDHGGYIDFSEDEFESLDLSYQNSRM
ncbi:MAG: hypothetical protein U5L96_12005 [Owenweeksia sp.]|nr:hypothetical protein [Owenweeksia sp.]